MKKKKIEIKEKGKEKGKEIEILYSGLIWNRKNHFLFNEEFRKIVFTILCIQRFYFRNIDKNIFFYLISNLVDIEYILPIKKNYYNFLTNLFYKKRQIHKYLSYYGEIYEDEKMKSDRYMYLGCNIKEKEKYRHNEYIDSLMKKDIDTFLIDENNIYFFCVEEKTKFIIFLGLNFNFYTNVSKRKRFLNLLCRQKIKKIKYNFSNILFRILF